MIHSADAAAGILSTCDIKLMSGNQLRPYVSIEGMIVPEGSNVNYIADSLNKVRIFCTTPSSVPTSANVLRGGQEREEVS